MKYEYKPHDKVLIRSDLTYDYPRGVNKRHLQYLGEIHEIEMVWTNHNKYALKGIETCNWTADMFERKIYNFELPIVLDTVEKVEAFVNAIEKSKQWLEENKPKKIEYHDMTEEELKALFDKWDTVKEKKDVK